MGSKAKREAYGNVAFTVKILIVLSNLPPNPNLYIEVKCALRPYIHQRVLILAAVRDYLLFVDTETSGLPKDWNAPYSTPDTWPYIVQIAWVIYTREGREVKRTNHYIGNDDFTIDPASVRIHGITREYLRKHGEPREEVMRSFQEDLGKYQPLVVGHFMQLDYHMIGVSLYRAGLKNPLESLPVFCTMKATFGFTQFSRRKFLTLGELNKRLFNKLLERPHDALYDALATAACFFRMLEIGDLNKEKIEKQITGEPDRTDRSRLIWIILTVVLIIGVILIINVAV